MQTVIYTLGHSNRPLQAFLDLLWAHAVDTVVDVRSVPWSRRFPWFRARELAATLARCGLGYVAVGEALGGRRRAGAPVPAPVFASAVDRVLGRAARERVALLCAEADPARCHRASLLAPAFIGRGARVVHLLAADRVEDHTVTAVRMTPRSPVIGDLFDG